VTSAAGTPTATPTAKSGATHLGSLGSVDGDISGGIATLVVLIASVVLMS